MGRHSKQYHHQKNIVSLSKQIHLNFTRFYWSFHNNILFGWEHLYVFSMYWLIYNTHFTVSCLFRASVDLSLLAWDVSHELWLTMEEGQGNIHVLITVSANTGHTINLPYLYGCSLPNVPYTSYPSHIPLLVRLFSYSPRHPLHSVSTTNMFLLPWPWSPDIPILQS